MVYMWCMHIISVLIYSINSFSKRKCSSLTCVPPPQSFPDFSAQFKMEKKNTVVNYCTRSRLSNCQNFKCQLQQIKAEGRKWQSDYFDLNSPGQTRASPTLPVRVNSSCLDDFSSSRAVVIFRQRWSSKERASSVLESVFNAQR